VVSHKGSAGRWDGGVVHFRSVVIVGGIVLLIVPPFLFQKGMVNMNPEIADRESQEAKVKWLISSGVIHCEDPECDNTALGSDVPECICGADLMCIDCGFNIGMCEC